jgi:hypothetical protein
MYLLEIDNLIEIHKNISEKNNNKFINIYIYAVIATIIDKMIFTDKFNFISRLLNDFNNNHNITKLKKYIIEYLDNILLKQNDKYIIDSISKSKSKSKSKDKLNNLSYIGFFLNNNYYLLNSLLEYNQNNLNIFIQCSHEDAIKIEKYKKLIISSLSKKKLTNLQKYNIIYGRVEFDINKNKYNFKIIDKSKEDIIYTYQKKISKRTKISGRECATFNISSLLNIRKILGLYDLKIKYKREYICNNIEIYLRYKQLIEKNNVIWFES